ncbi:MAG: bifunctional 4-hydroxy-2-oxoglutarate aldolase/2-dehydro-3-deoxy-phosphogluconate aldolase [Methylobacteriaceae bacterium]|jgi:2-dehydro-3-deoxyphosphogluconate aldolase/(4S)-4-hydroxy-2-oxoglutarate aldolase|nr:bifunctional 4-hydroxy-2-oxoglutarate aldolase/2-dehydro-3-deoxy-phosphogluconate aldolase [Methylobacteriaceae bacterium]
MTTASGLRARSNQEAFAARLKTVAVLPVITINRLDEAVPLAKALIAGGIKYLEITLRTPEGIKGAEKIIKEVPEAVVGLGTALTPADIKRGEDIGAQFILSPGATPTLLKAAAESSLPFIPGVATASEIMAAMEYGFFILKFFPATAAGGKAALSGFRGPFPDILFCPTGGINGENCAEWHALPNVITVGGSWLTPKKDIESGNWSAITDLARKACEAIKL